jgi:hypothetical protein
MSKKRNAQHWYQIHKSRAGSESVESSREVAEARKRVQQLELQAIQLKNDVSDTVLSSIRRFFFGRNEQEERFFQAEIALRLARSDMSQIVQNARSKGERSYSSDWASRNPDRAK